MFDVKNPRHLDYWINQPVDVYLVIRQSGQRSGEQTIRWMNVAALPQGAEGQEEPADRVRRREAGHGGGVEVRDRFFPPARGKVR